MTGAPNATGSVLTVNRVGFMGGVERIIINTNRAAQAAGLRPVLACPPGSLADEAESRGWTVHRLQVERGRSPRSPFDLFRLARAAAKSAEDILALAQRENVVLFHVHHPVTAFQVRHAAKRLNAPMLMHVHETLPMPRLYAALARWMRDRCDLFVCVSKASQAMVEALGVGQDRIRLIYNAVEERFLAHPAPAPEIAGPGPHIGVFGVLEPRKGQDLLVRACGRLLADHPSLRLWIVGPLSFESNSVYLNNLKTLASASGLDGRTYFTGHRVDVPELMAGMTAVALPSRGFESLPTALIEAAAVGRPVVGSDVGGVREIVECGVNGLVVAPNDVDGLAVALRRLIGPEGLKFGRCARERALARFAPDRFSDELAAIYRLLTSQGIAHPNSCSQSDDTGGAKLARTRP